MSIVDRAKNILFSPKTEWPVIDAEPATVKSIFTGYVVPMALIPAIAGVIAVLEISSSSMLGGLVHLSPASAITQGIVRYVLSLVGVYVCALVIDALAPSFGGTKNQVQAMKVAGYFPTAAWVASILTIIPFLHALTFLLVFLISLYSLYLLYLGLPICMKSPPERALGYTAVVIIVVIIVWFIIGAVATAVTGMAMGMGGM